MLSETVFDGFMCEICGQFHAGQYVSFASDSPDPYAALNDSRKESRTLLGSDQCVIDDKHHFIRGLVELPIIGLDEMFLWGGWASVWEKDYDEISQFWDTPEREKKIGPYKGRLANNVPGYDPGTLNLKCTIKILPVGTRPLFIIDEPSHPLAIEQHNGISLERVRQIASIVRHGKLK
jgi:hypothetical protein